MYSEPLGGHADLVYIFFECDQAVADFDLTSDQATSHVVRRVWSCLILHIRLWRLNDLLARC